MAGGGQLNSQAQPTYCQGPTAAAAAARPPTTSRQQHLPPPALASSPPVTYTTNTQRWKSCFVCVCCFFASPTMTRPSPAAPIALTSSCTELMWWTLGLSLASSHHFFDLSWKATVETVSCLHGGAWGGGTCWSFTDWLTELSDRPGATTSCLWVGGGVGGGGMGGGGRGRGGGQHTRVGVDLADQPRGGASCRQGVGPCVGCKSLSNAGCLWMI